MKRESVPPAVPAKDYLVKRLQDPATAAAYLNAAVEDDDPGAFLQALRNVTDAQGGIGRVANHAGLNRQQLYRTLSERGNPELRSLVRILSASGLRLEVTPKEQPQGSRRRGGAASSSRTSKGTKAASRARVPTPTPATRASTTHTWRTRRLPTR